MHDKIKLKVSSKMTNHDELDATASRPFLSSYVESRP